MKIPNINCKIEMFCTINPSESLDKIEKAISNIFPYSIINNNNFYDIRLKRVKMINSRSNFNQFAFHLSNPIMIIFRNIFLKLFNAFNFIAAGITEAKARYFKKVFRCISFKFKKSMRCFLKYH